jgi:hypothetical protein
MDKIKNMITHWKNSISVSSLYHRDFIVGFIAGAIIIIILSAIF